MVFRLAVGQGAGDLSDFGIPPAIGLTLGFDIELQVLAPYAAGWFAVGHLRFEAAYPKKRYPPPTRLQPSSFYDTEPELCHECLAETVPSLAGLGCRGSVQ
jgi:hypothetical protein